MAFSHVVVLFHTFFVACGNQKLYNYFGDGIGSHDIIRKSNVLGSIGCAFACTVEQRCVAFGYGEKQVTENCYLFKGRPSDFDADPQFQFFVNQKMFKKFVTVGLGTTANRTFQCDVRDRDRRATARFYAVKKKLRFLEAQAYCAKNYNYGQLVTLPDSGTFTQLNDFARQTGWAGKNPIAWIGASRRKDEKTWYWRDGTRMTQSVGGVLGFCLSVLLSFDNPTANQRWYSQHCTMPNETFSCYSICENGPAVDYVLLTKTVKYEDAVKDCHCLSNNGSWQLAVFESLMGMETILGANAFYDYRWWIGLDKVTQFEYVWVSGKTLNETGYSNWKEEPTSDEECVSMDKGVWYPTDCSALLWPLCQRIK